MPKQSKTPPTKKPAQDHYLVPCNNLAKTLATMYAYSRNNPKEALAVGRKAKQDLREILAQLKTDIAREAE